MLLNFDQPKEDFLRDFNQLRVHGTLIFEDDLKQKLFTSLLEAYGFIVESHENRIYLKG
jgi:hypothetical protein